MLQVLHKAIVRVAHIPGRSKFSQVLVTTLLLPFNALSFISYVFFSFSTLRIVCPFSSVLLSGLFSLILFWNFNLSKFTASGGQRPCLHTFYLPREKPCVEVLTLQMEAQKTVDQRGERCN